MARPCAILTPMANPTVEAEMRALLPTDFAWVTGRLVSSETDSMARLVSYAEGIASSVRQFDSMALSAVGFACTGSSYLIGRDREAELAKSLRIPVCWATAAIERKLSLLQARRIAVVSPYPAELHGAGLRYWRAAGIEVIHDARLDIGSADTRAIYGLGSDAARAAVDEARVARPDAVLLSGTGMPTLELLDPEGMPPVISSNLCLAEALQEIVRNSP